MRIFSLKILLVLFCLITCNLYLLTSKARASELSYIHSDHLGSTSLVTDEQGNVISQQVYYPYGSTRQKLKAEGLQPTAREYTGQVSDEDQTGLYYYNARYYDPAIGKFTQADSSEGPNRYQYTGNNPIRFIDPNGEADSAFDGGGGKSDSQSGSGSRFVVNLAQTFTDMSDFNTWKASSPEGRAQLALEAAAPAAVLGTELGILVTPSIIAGYETLLWKATEAWTRFSNGLPTKQIPSPDRVLCHEAGHCWSALNPQGHPGEAPIGVKSIEFFTGKSGRVNSAIVKPLSSGSATAIRDMAASGMAGELYKGLNISGNQTRYFGDVLSYSLATGEAESFPVRAKELVSHMGSGGRYSIDKIYQALSAYVQGASFKPGGSYKVPWTEIEILLGGK